MTTIPFFTDPAHYPNSQLDSSRISRLQDEVEVLSNVVDEKSLAFAWRRGFGFSPTGFSMPKTGRRFSGLPWSETGPGPLSGFGWGVFEKPCPIAEGDSTSLPNDLTKQCMIKRFPS